jgi:hypothetical protein
MSSQRPAPHPEANRSAQPGIGPFHNWKKKLKWTGVFANPSIYLGTRGAYKTFHFSVKPGAHPGLAQTFVTMLQRCPSEPALTVWGCHLLFPVRPATDYLQPVSWRSKQFYRATFFNQGAKLYSSLHLVYQPLGHYRNGPMDQTVRQQYNCNQDPRRPLPACAARRYGSPVARVGLARLAASDRPRGVLHALDLGRVLSTRRLSRHHRMSYSLFLNTFAPAR